MKMKPITTRKQWDDEQVDYLLDVYWTFLWSQERNEKYTKAQPVRDLAAFLERSKGSIECKMMNVSAVLAKHNHEYVKGYKPLSNYNKQLEDQVIDYMNRQMLLAQGIAVIG